MRTADPACQSRDFDKVVLPLMPYLHRFALRLTLDPEAASDLLQETMLRAIKGWTSYQPGSGGVATWLGTIMKNQHINNYRKSKSSRIVDVVDENGNPSFEYLTTTNPETSWDWALDQDYYRGKIETAFASLPQNVQVPTKMYWLDNIPYKVIASTLGLSLASVKSRVFRGRKEIKKQLRLHYFREVGPHALV